MHVCAAKGLLAGDASCSPAQAFDVRVLQQPLYLRMERVRLLTADTVIRAQVAERHVRGVCQHLLIQCKIENIQT